MHAIANLGHVKVEVNLGSGEEPIAGYKQNKG